MRERILIVDDDVELYSLLLRCLEREGYRLPFYQARKKDF